MDYTNLFCIRFDFGVPLEDIFPPHDIHPKLQNLLRQAQISLFNSNMSVDQILSYNFYKFSTEKIIFKDQFVREKLTCLDSVRPEILLWSIKDFLEDLPLPLFPKFVNNQKHDWSTLAMLCKLCKMRRNSSLDSKIFWCIYSLPEANFVMVNALMDFFRNICLNRNFSKRQEKRNLIATVKYFCCPLFLRNYCFVFSAMEEKTYYPLLLYLILNWCRIRQRHLERDLDYKKKYSTSYFVPKNIDTFEAFQTFCVNSKEREKIQTISEITETDNSNNEPRDCACQTSNWLLTNSNNFPPKTTKVTINSVNTTVSSITEDDCESSRIAKEDFNDDIIEQNIQPLCCSMNNSVIRQNKDGPQLEINNADDHYEKITNIDVRINEIKNSSLLSSNSETVIYKKKSSLADSFLKKKLLKLNKSFSSAVLKLNGRLKMRVEPSMDNTQGHGDYKYNLLKDNSHNTLITKQQSFSNCSPDIKYKKLLTLQENIKLQYQN